MAQRNTGRFIGALAALAVFLPLVTAAGCKLFNKELKAFGEDCQSDTDCETLECATYGSVCTKACTYDRECGSGFVCRARDGGRPGDACAKPTGVPNGQSCNNAAECQSGNCLKPVGDSDALGFCSNHCETETDCPDSHKTCLSISDSGQVKFCLPGGGGGTNIGGPEAPKFVAPRPITTVKAPVTTTTSTTTTTATATATVPAKTTATPLGPTATGTATAAPTATTQPTATAQPTATSTATTTVKKPVLILPTKKK